MLCEQAPEQWSNDARDPEHRSEQTHVLATFTRGHDVGDDCHDQHHQAAATDACSARVPINCAMLCDSPASADAATKIATADCSMSLRP